MLDDCGVNRFEKVAIKMDSEYDQKFEEMKRHIPFLERMIRRLESTGTGPSNPRQAQLDKIRSLRLLLLDKKKRMKMENLIKCEQVLLNLYAKVEPARKVDKRDKPAVKKAPDPGFAIDTPTPQEKSELEAVRSKLKTVVKTEETLPEILRVNEVEEMHTAGSKEPALFQRRPNKPSLSPNYRSPTKIKQEKASPPPSASKRNYTRVLVSPDTSSRCWSSSEGTPDKPLFSRRSPRRSPRRPSPSYHKKERKKSKESTTRKSNKGLNITLNVPEDSLSTLNTKDIFSRIINCKDGDVDIDTLRELRKQILTELKKTGARDDISDLILKSYKKKTAKPKKRNLKQEVEEGELSDSESEVIENVYGSLSGNLVFKDENETKDAADKDKSRKIQICLMLNPDKPKNDSMNLPITADVSELEMYEKETEEVDKIQPIKVAQSSETKSIENDTSTISIDSDIEVTASEKINKGTNDKQPQEAETEIKTKENVKNTANFYKPIADGFESETNKTEESKTESKVNNQNVSVAETESARSEVSTKDIQNKKSDSIEAQLEKMEKPVEIPLLHDKTMPQKPTNSAVSEIDILQALKNEILSETITIPGAEETPHLHQPKINKVASAKEILPKVKRISIENYKQKTEELSRKIKDSIVYFPQTDSKEDSNKKSSLKLTEKECERFNIPKMSFDDDSSDDDEITPSDLYNDLAHNDLAPKSPDRDDANNVKSAPPVIIPVDPVKPIPVIPKLDVDMRTLPKLSPTNSIPPTLPFGNVAGLSSNETKPGTLADQSKGLTRPIFDPRVKRDIQSSQSPSPRSLSSDRMQRSGFSNISSSPATMSHHQSFDVESHKKHVYVPSLGLSETRETSVARDTRDKSELLRQRKSRYEDVGDASCSSSDMPQSVRYGGNFIGDYGTGKMRPQTPVISSEKSNIFGRTDDVSTSNYIFGRAECPPTPNHPFGRAECPPTSSQSFGRLECPPTPSHMFGRAECPSTPSHSWTDCPSTPSHSFGRAECPPTPSHSFGRAECPATPSHSFGRTECPPTPSHPFGRSDCQPTTPLPFGRAECPPTPNHAFGRAECPPTPSHHFGRAECPPTPSHPFGRSECPPTPSHSFGRSDHNQNHNFASNSYIPEYSHNSNMPLTQTPFFGRNECPPTPNHQFTRFDGPSTKNKYGLLECPNTPSHPFGRSDGAMNNYGRPEYNAQKYTKDPRLNRKSEYENNSVSNDRDRGYKDRGYYRGNSYNSQKPFSGSENYKSQDRELDRNSKFRRQTSRDISRREPSAGRSFPKDHESDRVYSRERGQYGGYEDGRRSHGERNVGRSVYYLDNRDKSAGRYSRDDREKSIGHSRDDQTRTSYRAQSIGRNSSMESEKSLLSVKSYAGRSFTIDTSTNATFQQFLEKSKGHQVSEYCFDARRQRAASVGRILTRESSCQRVISDDIKLNMDKRDKKADYRRASSVGRDLVDYHKEKRSFLEIKADFKTYVHPTKEFNTAKIKNIDSKSKTKAEHSFRSRRDSYDKHKEEKRSDNSSKTAYSPRKNSRDPRMRKETKRSKNDKYGEDNRTKKSGIVYSNDNIVKGAILASGYGVKNYKIPKIKRVVEEKVTEEPTLKKCENPKETEIEASKTIRTEESLKLKDKVKDITPKLINKNVSKEKGNDDSEYKSKETPNQITKASSLTSDSETETLQIDETVKPSEEIERRITRRRKRLSTSISESEIVTKPRKSKKAVISDSESDPETTSKDRPVSNLIKRKGKKANDDFDKLAVPSPLGSPIKENTKGKQTNLVDIHSNFGLELEMFSENVASDPVLDNINALIADLDNDLDSASKNEPSNDFMNEITLENMMQNITTPQDTCDNGEEFNQVLKAVDELSKPSDNEILSMSVSDTVKGNENNSPNNSNKMTGDTETTRGIANTKDSIKKNTIEQLSPKKAKPADFSDKRNITEDKKDENITLHISPTTANDNLVSTTEHRQESVGTEDKLKSDERSMDGCSTPDSTINTDDVSEKNNSDTCVADSTNEEVQSETNVTSTETVEPKPSSSKASDSELGNLLTVLQDKSKIEKLLSMLGDQSDNEKIRKKLEKLKEIVSDDETEDNTEQLDESKDNNAASNDDVKDSDTSLISEDKTETIKDDSKSVQDESINEEDQDNDDTFVDAEEEEFTKTDESGSQVTKTKLKKKMPGKKSKVTKKGKGRPSKKATSIAEKRVTRATAAVVVVQKPKKPPRELQKLHDDIKEFIRDDILSTSGIRMCRLAKMMEDKTKDEVAALESESVISEKVKTPADKNRDQSNPEKVRKKPGPKPKPKAPIETPEPEKPKYKPGPKSKTKNTKDVDPYAFEVESCGDTTTEKMSEDDSDNSSDSDEGSLASLASSKSCGSTEILADIKKKVKRKRPAWQDGVIKPKYKKKKIIEPKQILEPPQATNPTAEKEMTMLDMDCFTDKNYCFRENELVYPCRLCSFTGTDIVYHYKNEHPHVEIPLSRMDPAVAKDAIEQCKEINFQAISKISSDKYVCIFCFQEFAYNKNVLETFFWHVVSMHTGEYKHNCSKCTNENRCQFSLDIPPPPKDTSGQLIGYICKKCNFTQLSIENLKTHVIVRHNDEQTFVYTINLSAMSKKALKELLRKRDAPEPLVLKSIALKEEIKSDDVTTDDKEHVASVCEPERVLRKRAKPQSPLPSIKSKITFEADDNASDAPNIAKIKIEQEDTDEQSENVDEVMHDAQGSKAKGPSETEQPADVVDKPVEPPRDVRTLQSSVDDVVSQSSDDIVDYPHFKISFTESGTKEYICCINGKDNHFKTTLLISMKKHVQLKHSENWEGYCFVCKVIVTPQGAHNFRDCLQHYLDKHLDDFPVFQKEVVPETTPEETPPQAVTSDSPTPTKPYINVRPIRELISTSESPAKETSSFPVIQSVVSLGTADTPLLQPSYPAVNTENKQPEVIFKYEEVQARVMSSKHRVVLENMIVRNKLVKVFKCAGRFCSFTSDSPEDSLLHASTHQRLGGVDTLNCSYCDFDSMGNAIDLVMHVFKQHGHCQYSCGQCFYRAAASQSVGVHAAKVHGLAAPSALVLRTTTVPANAPADSNMLTREQAVPYYFCKHTESNGNKCKFRTYTPDKFCEHLQQKHTTASSHTCYICQLQAPSPSELVQHMKSHGLKLYQCTWCVLGADNETELLSHVATTHPSKQPQAYLRIITNKEGSNELRVLPLAFLNKMKVPIEDVTPSTTKEDPVREAERSLDLEKLIGLNILVGAQPEPAQTADTQVSSPPDTKPPKEIIQPAEPVSTTALLPPTLPQTPLNPLATISQANVPAPAPSPVAPAPNLTPDDPQTVSPAPFVKIEAEEIRTPQINDVVVIDSDDDEPRQPVIDLSDEDSLSNVDSPVQQDNTRQKVPLEILSTCPKCRQVYKNIHGLKKHLFYCYPNKEAGCRCAHCPYRATSRDNIIKHYMDDHCDTATTPVASVYQCGICRTNLISLSFAKRHVRNVHKEKDVTVSSVVENGISYYTINAAKKHREVPKRKSSVNEIPSKRRFKPQEINELPINPILDHLVYCDLCEFSTKVRLNMVRHLQLHAAQQPVAQVAPVNPVPHLETNEMHFDKMVNLASSSLGGRAAPPERPYSVVQLSAAEAAGAAQYPRYVAARTRHSCGAPACSYTAPDEPTLRRHWDALHAAAAPAFRCVHCPASQSLDTSRPVTAGRVMQHLKMHDENLYACSHCQIYHFKREVMEKHMTEVHPFNQLIVVRENANTVSAVVPTAQPVTVGTMDLKPWQCGFCQFKSMLRPEVVEHCSKFHQSKMQFRCAYCPYRASVLENVHNHLSHSHASEPVDVIYYYYRVGSVPDEDGTPRWLKQWQKMASSHPEVKIEEQEFPASSPLSATPVITAIPSTSAAPTPSIAPVSVDLNLVKKEVEEDEVLESLEELCSKFGKLCEPNGINYRCPLCPVVVEETREAMQSHLYEELQYRRWGCGLCKYKAFHKTGLVEHMTAEHRRQYDHIELPKDINKEKWVAAQLDHQAGIIQAHKANLAKQKIQTERVNKPGPSTAAPPTIETVEKYSAAQLIEAFGEFGAPKDTMFCCPKCNILHGDETTFRDHLETELNKIRWGCTNCSAKYQTYHEAQFHCKSHEGSSRPKEAIRDPSMRAAWVTNIIQTQKKMLQSVTLPASAVVSEPPTPEKIVPESDNSLLVVRYEEKVTTPEQGAVRPRPSKRPAPETDDERLVIDEADKRAGIKRCRHCEYSTKSSKCWKDHMLKHYNLKPYSCCYCEYSCTSKQGVVLHTMKLHPEQPLQMRKTPLPPGVPYIVSAKTNRVSEDDQAPIICLFCEKTIPDAEIVTHLHDNVKPDFAKKGDVVFKCCICLVLRVDVKSLQDHHQQAHPNLPINYALFKLQHETRETHFCGHCENIGFKYIRDLKTHHNAAHPALPLKYSIVPYIHNSEEMKKIEEDLIAPLIHKNKVIDTTPKTLKILPKPMPEPTSITRHIIPIPMNPQTVPMSSLPKPIEAASITIDTSKPVKYISKPTEPLPKTSARKSTSKPPTRRVAMKSTTKLPHNIEEVSHYLKNTKTVFDYDHCTTSISLCNRTMTFTAKKLSEIMRLYPQVVVVDVVKHGIFKLPPQSDS
ncbi:uncharacterized protein LOC111360081 isoform X1 [Spodoptera litura]|uniref:Uncharacterized protein LOC111360081 isoform X1 n=2 Tax=Spodoptera litura TaxID=69820 RepID=A0A9J7EIU4_SPOLT|nr:uncharacterized protein LOC111360081 isoform X1 [Spodoptera litura]